MVLGTRIRQVRLRHGMSQAELARRVHVSATAMNNLEQGHTHDPHFSVMCAIAQALGVSLDQFAPKAGAGE